MKVCVVDASFVLQALLGLREAPVKRLHDLLAQSESGKVRLLSPELFVYEVANGLRFTITDIDLVESTLQNISAFPIEIVSVTWTQINEVCRLAVRDSTTVYDSSYHFLAIVYGGVFITCDEKYYAKAKDLGNIELI
jgi:predicted nucleic acid-binding protein